jgi:ubiquinone/menaquinone biosynthesis C-methylase UbiE
MALLNMPASKLDIEASKRREPDYYNEIAEGYDALHREEQERKIKLILETFPFDTNEKLLDVGCGTGFSLEMWPCKDCTGAEPSAAMIKQAPMSVRNNIIHVRAEDMSIFDDNEFDVVVSITAIHNFKGVEDGLLEMKRVGKERFVFSVLKKNERMDEIDMLIRKHFRVRDVLEEQHDRIYVIY